MMTARGLVPILLAAAFVSPALAAEPPAAEDLVQRVLAAAGGQKAFEALGVLELTIREEETTTEGETTTAALTGYLDSHRLTYLRVDMPGEVIVASNPTGGWASQEGKVDDRPQVPRLAAGTARQKLFPLLLPFSLAMDGISYGDVHEGELEGTPVWYVPLTFSKMFFTSAIMNTSWFLTVRKSDDALMAAEFLPPVEFRQVQKEGIRYRYLKTQQVGGVTLPQQILLEGIDFNYQPTNHFRVTKLTAGVRGPYEPTLFLNPDRLEEMEEAVPGLDQGPGAEQQQR